MALPSSWVLLLANTVPLLGVLVLGWEVFPILFLFWSENVLVGLFTVLRMLGLRPLCVRTWLGKVFTIPFFVFHFGLFTAIHGIAVFSIFGTGSRVPSNYTLEGPYPPPDMILDTIEIYGLWPALIALGLSHGFSWGHNFLVRGEYREATLDTIMLAPYSRVIVLHLVVMAAGFLIMVLGAPLGALLFLILLKAGADLRSHAREHLRPTPAEREYAPSDPR